MKLLCKLGLLLLLLFISSCKTATGPVLPSANSGDQLFYDVITGPDSTQFGVHVINTDGTGDKLLYLNGRITSAPRGGQLVFFRRIDTNDKDSTAFYLGDIFGAKEQRLYAIKDWSDFAIFSADGQKIVYSDTVNQISFFDILSPKNYRMPIKMELGSQLPVISDDSKTIYAIFDNPILGLFSIDINSGDIRKVTSDDIRYFIASEEHRTYDISPDGSKVICFVNYSVFDSLSSTSGYRLTMKDILSGTAITDSTLYDEYDDVVWSPKGDKIAFEFEKERDFGYGKIGIYDVTSRKTLVFPLPVDEPDKWIKSIEWSKDEESLYIVVFNDQKYASQIVKMNAKTGDYSIFNTGINKIDDLYRSKDLGEH